MSNQEKDPFEQYDHLFEETDQKYHPEDKKAQKSKPTDTEFDDLNLKTTDDQKKWDRKKKASLLFWIIGLVVLFNNIPPLNQWVMPMPFFLPIIVIAIVLSILYRANKR